VLSASVCSWTATANDAWLSVGVSSGSGTGDITFTAQPNSGVTPRSGTLTVAGQNYTATYTVAQAGMPCSYTLFTASASVAPGGGSGTAGFSTTTQTGCSPSAVSYSNWITATTSFNGTSGTINFTAAANTVASARSGTIQLGDQTFTVNQIASTGTCTFSLSAYGATFSAAGGSGDVWFSASAYNCTPVIGKSPELTVGLPTLLPSGIYDLPYTVPLYQSFVTWIRLLEINISGQAFTIKQTSW